MLSGRAYNTVIGGGVDQGRSDQVALAIPHMLSNPVTGHGFSIGGEIIGYGAPGIGFGDAFYSVDSYMLSLLVETGVPSLLFFLMMIGGALWICVKGSLFDVSPRGAMTGALAAALTAFAVNRVVLSERENHTLFFVLCGMVAACAALRTRSAGGNGAAVSKPLETSPQTASKAGQESAQNEHASA